MSGCEAHAATHADHCAAPPSQAGWGYRAESQVAGLGPDANLLRFVKQHVMGKVG